MKICVPDYFSCPCCRKGQFPVRAWNHIWFTSLHSGEDVTSLTMPHNKSDLYVFLIKSSRTQNSQWNCMIDCSMSQSIFLQVSSFIMLRTLNMQHDYVSDIHVYVYRQYNIILQEIQNKSWKHVHSQKRKPIPPFMIILRDPGYQVIASFSQRQKNWWWNFFRIHSMIFHYP